VTCTPCLKKIQCSPYLLDSTVEVVRLDFSTESSRLLLRTQLPDNGLYDPGIHARIYGGIAAVYMPFENQQYRTLLINLEMDCVILLTSTICDVALISGHIIFASLDTALCTMRVDVWAERSLAEFWCPCGLAATWDPIPIGNIPKLYSEIIELSSFRRARNLCLSAHCSPLHEGTYKFWIRVSFHFTRRNNGPAYAYTPGKFRLSMPFPSLSLSSSLYLLLQRPASHRYSIYHDVSYSGHTYVCVANVVGPRVQVLRSPESWSDWESHSTTLLDKDGRLHMSEYSGALTYTTGDSVFVNYYE
jgi:hypothetical protein